MKRSTAWWLAGALSFLGGAAAAWLRPGSLDPEGESNE